MKDKKFFERIGACGVPWELCENGVVDHFGVAVTDDCTIFEGAELRAIHKAFPMYACLVRATIAYAEAGSDRFEPWFIEAVNLIQDVSGKPWDQVVALYKIDDKE